MEFDHKVPVENPIGKVLPPNTYVYLGCNVTDRSARHLLSRTIDFVNESSRNLANDFALNYKKSRVEATGLSNPLSAGFLTRSGMHFPQFSIIDHTVAPEFFAQTPFPEVSIDDGNLLLAFLMPKPIAREFRQKYEQEEGRSKPAYWEKFAMPIKRSVRKQVRTIEDKKQTLIFKKINDKGVHNSTLFHYLWEVSLPEHSFYYNGGIGPTPTE